MNERIARLRKESFETKPAISIERALLTTEFYRENAGKYSVPVMRALNFKNLCEKKGIYIGPEELIVGERGDRPRVVSTFPELNCHSAEDLRVLNSRPMTSYVVDPKDIEIYEEKVIPYWQGRSMRDRAFAEIPQQWKDLYGAGLFTEFMEQRAPGHTTLDGTIYRMGMLDFKAKIAEARAGLDSGWVDVYENQGKRKGAYSWGSYGTHPYILLNYDGRINDVFTLAHELGHSMHSFYSHRSQPYPTADYAIFVAEVASTTNEALLLDHLLKTRRDRRERIFLLNHFLEEVRTTLYRQAMFASFERTVHERSEAGEALTPEDLSDLWTKLNRRYYGPQIEVDPGIALEWARIPHFYTPFYVYQYCTGFAAAQALSRGILEGKPGARERTLTLLSRGSSDTPIALLKEAGVDMTTPEPIEETIRLFERALDEMEELLDRGDR